MQRKQQRRNQREKDPDLDVIGEPKDITIVGSR